jgi:predicted nucleic acid-binding protein
MRRFVTRRRFWRSFGMFALVRCWARGGFGLSIEQTERKANLIQKHFEMLPDMPATFTEWRKIVSDYSVVGVQVHDAKLVASMNVHKVEYLVTFNEKDFKRFSIKVIHPQDI